MNIGLASSFIPTTLGKQLASLPALLAFLTNQPYIYESLKYIILGSVIEAIRRGVVWIVDRFRFRYSISANFREGDPTYDWIIHFLNEQNVWHKTHLFDVTAKSSQRKWGIALYQGLNESNADYVPAYGCSPCLFRWKGYWVEAFNGGKEWSDSSDRPTSVHSIRITIFTLDVSVLSALVEHARQKYIEVSTPHVIIHTADSISYGPGFQWNNVKRKKIRPLNSLILDEGVLESLLEDAREFFAAEDWYNEAGIPHHRGYLLYGPPGTGKTSTIYSLAGELGLEIYSLSLAAGFVDDSFLQRAASSMPKRSILLMEDIDCAFPSREDEDAFLYRTPGVSLYTPGSTMNPKRSNVTLSALLNVVDGVGSEEGKLFFATTNYADRIDPALLRPGRIDRKIEYKKAIKYQARALFDRFFPEKRFGGDVRESLASDVGKTLQALQPASETAFTSLSDLSSHFAASVPDDTFTTAELQGYLLSCRTQPIRAAAGVRAWVEREYEEKQAMKEKDEERRRRREEERETERRDRQVVVNIGGQEFAQNTSARPEVDEDGKCEEEAGTAPTGNKGEALPADIATGIFASVIPNWW